MLCPTCNGRLTFQDGAIDPEYHSPDFVYCDNEACTNNKGYDPVEAMVGVYTQVAKITRLYPKEEE
jgi:hypothetical protein